jgi:SAM-dependent MidA family methyltransferase
MVEENLSKRKELLGVIERVRWVRAAQILNNEKSQSVVEFSNELVDAILVWHEKELRFFEERTRREGK